jgi:hypothetical protein
MGLCLADDKLVDCVCMYPGLIMIVCPKVQLNRLCQLNAELEARQQEADSNICHRYPEGSMGN